MSSNQTLWLNLKSGLRLGFETLVLCAVIAPVLEESVSFLQASWAGKSYTIFYLTDPVMYILFSLLFGVCYILPCLVSGLALSFIDSHHVIVRILVIVVMSLVGLSLLNATIKTSVGNASDLLVFHVLILLVQGFLFLRHQNN